MKDEGGRMKRWDGGNGMTEEMARAGTERLHDIGERRRAFALARDGQFEVVVSSANVSGLPVSDALFLALGSVLTFHPS
jgi:hypothetical protein